MENRNTEVDNTDKKLHISADIISSFFLHYYNKYEGKKIKFIVDKNSTVSYGNGKYIMIVEEGKGYDTVLEMFFLEECEIIGKTY
jgi:hypothetical protein